MKAVVVNPTETNKTGYEPSRTSRIGYEPSRRTSYSSDERAPPPPLRRPGPLEG